MKKEKKIPSGITLYIVKPKRLLIRGICNNGTKSRNKYYRTFILRIISYISGHKIAICNDLMSANGIYRTLTVEYAFDLFCFIRMKMYLKSSYFQMKRTFLSFLMSANVCCVILFYCYTKACS